MRSKILFAKALAAGGPFFLIAGCGGSATGSNEATATATSPSGWNATNACAVLDKKVVAATLGGTLKSTNLGAVKSEGGGFPLYSQCEYLFTDGRMLVFGTGQATNGASLAEQVADMKRQAGMISNIAPADFPGVGKAGLWAADVHSLYAFFGDGRFVSATLSQTDFRKPTAPIEKIQADDIAILRKAGA